MGAELVRKAGVTECGGVKVPQPQLRGYQWGCQSSSWVVSRGMSSVGTSTAHAGPTTVQPPGVGEGFHYLDSAQLFKHRNFWLSNIIQPLQNRGCVVLLDLPCGFITSFDFLGWNS